MALTAVVIDPQASLPKDIAFLPALADAANQGLQFSLLADANNNVSGGPNVVEIVADQLWFWSYRDAQTAANGTMIPVQPYERLPVQISNSGKISIYVRNPGTTPNYWVVQRL